MTIPVYKNSAASAPPSYGSSFVLYKDENKDIDIMAVDSRVMLSLVEEERKLRAALREMGALLKKHSIPLPKGVVETSCGDICLKK
jgi:hypothetical protein